MVFKSDKQRKGFFANQGNVRSNVSPTILSRAVGFKTGVEVREFAERKKLNVTGFGFSKENKHFVEFESFKIVRNPSTQKGEIVTERVLTPEFKDKKSAKRFIELLKPKARESAKIIIKK